MKNQKLSEFDLFKGSIKCYTVRVRVSRTATRGQTEGEPVLNDYFKLFVTKSKDDQEVIFDRIESYFDNYEGIEKIIEKGDLRLETYNKRYRSKDSMDIVEIKPGEASKIKLEPCFKASNLEEFKVNKTYVQTAMDGFQESEYGLKWTDGRKFKYLIDSPSSRKESEKGTALTIESAKKNLNFEIVEGITKISSPKSFSLEICENFSKKFIKSLNNYHSQDCLLTASFDMKQLKSLMLSFEKFLFDELVKPHLLTVKETIMEPTPFETCAHLYDTVFGTGKNSAEGFNEVMLEIENKEQVNFKHSIKLYKESQEQLFGSKENYIREVRKFIGFKKIEIKN